MISKFFLKKKKIDLQIWCDIDMESQAYVIFIPFLRNLDCDLHILLQKM